MGANKKVVRFDLATESDAICRPPRTMWVYLYRNHEERPTDYEAKIYLNSDGEVSFQPGGKECTPWHGHWKCTGYWKKIDMKLSHEGDEEQLKDEFVYHNAEGTPIGKHEFWTGRDHRNSLITMTLLGKYVECIDSYCWEKV